MNLAVRGPRPAPEPRAGGFMSAAGAGATAHRRRAGRKASYTCMSRSTEAHSAREPAYVGVRYSVEKEYTSPFDARVC